MLVWFLCCCGTLFRVGHQGGEARVSVQRFEVRIFIQVQTVGGGQPVVYGLA
jgi:hypothetical protein